VQTTEERRLTIVRLTSKNNGTNVIQKLLFGYRFTVLTLMNTFVVIVFLNVILFAIFSVRDHYSQDPVSAKYGHQYVSLVYPGLSQSEIYALLKETWSRAYIYDPFTQFKERPYRGTYVNVDVNGYRRTKDQGTWPPLSSRLNIFLFGGSTIFGYGVSDDQTVATYLQASLETKLGHRVSVYNFGRGHYYSTQERILYENILASGFIPDVAIFVDGLNDFFYNTNEPIFTTRFHEFVSNEPLVQLRFHEFVSKGDAISKGDASDSVIGFISKTSIGRAVRKIKQSLSKSLQEDTHTKRLAEHTKETLNNHDKYADPKVVDVVINRYLNNKKLIEAVSKAFGVTPIFVWQPVPTYHYDQRYHLFSEGGYGQHSYSSYGYERMAKVIEVSPLDNNFLWLADIQKDKTEPLYVDKFHYSARFSKQFAIAIADLLIERSLIPMRENVSQISN